MFISGITFIKSGKEMSNNKINNVAHHTFRGDDVIKKNIFLQQIKTPICFCGNYNTINSSREAHDYGEIFCPNTDFRLLNFGIFTKAKKDFAELTNCNFTNTDFSKAFFFSGDFTGSDFTEANFECANFASSNLGNIITQNTDFKYSNFTECDFSDTIIGSGTDMSYCNFAGADLSKANLKKALLLGSLYDENTKFAENFSPDDKGMILIKEGNDYSDMTFERMNLGWLNFNNNNFRNSRFKRANLKRATFENCDFRNTEFKRAYANKALFKNSDFSNSNLKQFNMKNAILENVNLSNCNLRGAVLTWNNATNVNLTNSVYDQYTQFNQGFNPEEHGMRYKESSLKYYGLQK